MKTTLLFLFTILTFNVFAQTDTIFLPHQEMIRGVHKHHSDTLRVHYSNTHWQSAKVFYVTPNELMIDFNSLKGGCRQYIAHTARGFTGYVIANNNKQWRYGGYDAIKKRHYFLPANDAPVKIEN